MTSKKIIIKPKFDFRMIFKANLYLLFNKLSFYIIGFFYLLICFSVITLFFLLDDELRFEYYEEIKNAPMLYIILFFPFLLVLFVYFSSKKQLHGNYRIKENFEFIFNSNYFQEKGETFDIKHYWDKLLKVKEKKSYFLIYQNKNRANIIPKNSFNKEELIEFKILLNSIDIKKRFIN